MKTAGSLALLLPVASQSALAGPAPRRHARVEHDGALATAALVGEYAPSLNDIAKSVLQKLFDGQTDITVSGGQEDQHESAAEQLFPRACDAPTSGHDEESDDHARFSFNLDRIDSAIQIRELLKDNIRRMLHLINHFGATVAKNAN